MKMKSKNNQTSCKTVINLPNLSYVKNNLNSTVDEIF